MSSKQSKMSDMACRFANFCADIINSPIVNFRAEVVPPTQSITKPKRGRLGLIQLLSNGMRVQAHTVASIGLFGEVYDNINFMNHTAEQIIGRHGRLIWFLLLLGTNQCQTDNQENGTCITIFKLWAARLENMETSVLKAAFDGARPLCIDDIVHTEDEQHFFHECLIHVVIRIIIKFSHQEKITALQRVTDQKQPWSSFFIEPHQTEIYPVDAFDIDESSITGNAHADEAVVDVLELRKCTENFWERVRFIAGDQLSIARLHALENIRAGQESGYEGFAWGIWILGLFHTKMANINGILLPELAILPPLLFTTQCSIGCLSLPLLFPTFVSAVILSLSQFMPAFSTAYCLYQERHC